MKPSTGHILYAEDDEDTRELVTYLLVESHYKVTAAANGDDALRLARTNDFDLYVIDNQDRSGGSVELIDQNLQKFFAAARQRPELAGVGSQFSASSPQIYADVDRDKVLKQGVAIADVYQTMQAYLGGLFLNQFNRFGRQWRVFLQAEGEERLRPSDIEQYYVRNNDGNMVPLSSLVTTRRISGPEYTNRFNVYRGPDNWIGGTRVQLGTSYGRARRSGQTDVAAGNWL
jgi:multidrug efflux pump subunit AcrB